MWAHRHMHQYGTTREHSGNVAIAARKHANRNLYAMMRDKPLDMNTLPEGRGHRYPADVSTAASTDGAPARVVTSVERARDQARSRRSCTRSRRRAVPIRVHLREPQHA